MTEPSGNTWGQIKLETWRDTPCTLGRIANEGDVKEGRAVFYVDGPSQPTDVQLPRCALFHEGGSALPVIIIQAESREDGEVLVGYRPLSGGNGICLLGELDLLDGPNDMFH